MSPHYLFNGECSPHGKGGGPQPVALLAASDALGCGSWQKAVSPSRVPLKGPALRYQAHLACVLAT